MKSLEYEDVTKDQYFAIKAFIVSAPEELELSNVDMEGNKGFFFKISVSTEPNLPVSPSELIDFACH